VKRFSAIIGLLSCPDDSAPLSYDSSALTCSSCARRFAIHGNNFAEILPRQPRSLSAAMNLAYHHDYLQAFDQPYSYSETSTAWGAEEVNPKSWVRKRRRQVAMVQHLIAEGTLPGDSILCDIAAGAGYYTFDYASIFRFVLHCDLSVDNLNYARRKAHSLGIQNIFFLRADYFALPFRHSLDRIICMDTLIRGEAHDAIVLANIARSLRPDGLAVVDFHNWWHNPLRRLGLLPQNFENNRSYRRPEAEQLLRQASIEDYTRRRFLQELDPDSKLAALLTPLLPSTQLVYRFGPREERL
jgi:ubiquinone/menaquinone biosynthesis C-methylase UbiE